MQQLAAVETLRLRLLEPRPCRPYLVRAAAEVEDRHRHLHAGREGPAAQQVLSVQFDAVQVAVIAHQPHLRQPLAARQAQLFARQLGLPVEKPVFGTRHKVDGGHRRRRQVGQIVRHLDPVGQRTADQVAEIASRSAFSVRRRFNSLSLSFTRTFNTSFCGFRPCLRALSTERSNSVSSAW